MILCLDILQPKSDNVASTQNVNMSGFTSSCKTQEVIEVCRPQESKQRCPYLPYGKCDSGKNAIDPNGKTLCLNILAEGSYTATARESRMSSLVERASEDGLANLHGMPP